MTPIDYARLNRAIALDRLMQFLRIPSISTDPAHATDVQQAAKWVADAMGFAGLVDVRIDHTERHPVVFGRSIPDPAKPTVLIYGHYDVQPPDPIDMWRSMPFEPVVRDGFVYARGAADDKGQLLPHLLAVSAFTATDTPLPVNVIVIAEGEEEIGSPNLEPWIRAHAADLAADVVLVSDTHMVSESQPSIVRSLRGLTYLEVEVLGPPTDLHSGGFGGGVINPANVLCQLLGSLVDSSGRITIPEFYHRVRPLTATEYTALEAVPFDMDAFRRAAGEAGNWAGEAGHSLAERLGTRPTLDINGLTAGWQGQGAKTVLPSRASAKVSMRLVPDQDPDEIADLFKAHISAIAPLEVEVIVTTLHGGWPASTDIELPAMAAAVEAYETAFGAKPVFTCEGGSIPVVATFQQLLGISTVLMGFGLPEDGLHGPNERFLVKNFDLGTEASILFMEAFARQQR